ncbi:MAG: hypothetical protein QM534_16175 [Sediminibacterium sp.]|nr:hypothetical protein [Sediminibacterium sp.]
MTKDQKKIIIPFVLITLGVFVYYFYLFSTGDSILDQNTYTRSRERYGSHYYHK